LAPMTSVLVRLFVLGLATLLLALGCQASPPTPTVQATAEQPTITPRTPAASSTLDPEASPVPLEPRGVLQEGRVMRITDGDTIWVRFNGRDWRVRYIGIDAPEMGDVVPEPWAREATDANARLVLDRVVYLERDVSETDRFGRLLRYVWLHAPAEEGGDPRWVLANLELVRFGYARAASFPPDVAYQELLRAAEAEARDAGAGLWAEEGP
jgi:micrococcal nuclease